MYINMRIFMLKEKNKGGEGRGERGEGRGERGEGRGERGEGRGRAERGEGRGEGREEMEERGRENAIKQYILDCKLNLSNHTEKRGRGKVICDQV